MSRDHQLFVGAVVLQHGSILLVRQAAGHSLAGRWTIPWGRLESGEQPAAGAVREVREEAAMEAVAEGLVGAQVIPAEKGAGVALIFQCTPVAGEPWPDDHETDAARFFSVAEFERLSEPVEEWCRWIVREAMKGTLVVLPVRSDTPYSPCEGYF